MILLLGLYFFRGGPELTHMDFVTGGPGALEFCDAANPRFLPVVARSSPVSMALRTGAIPIAWDRVESVLLLRTNTGKAIGAGDLQPTDGGMMNLLIVDPELGDIQSVQPLPGTKQGEWPFAFTPHRAGVYRIFADLTPVATGQEMYASVDLVVKAAPGPELPVRPPASGQFDRNGLRFTLRPALGTIRAREPADLVFTVSRLDGSSLALRPSAGAAARLVAFDIKRTGFVNLRPEPYGATSAGEPAARLTFKVMIPDSGRYVVWSRVNAGGGEIAASFSLDVIP